MTNEEAGRALDAAERDLRDVRAFLAYCKNHPDVEQADIRVTVTIPKAALVPGGMVLQKLMECALIGRGLVPELIADALRALEEDAARRADVALVAVNDQRRRLGLPTVGDDDAARARLNMPPPGAEQGEGGDQQGVAHDDTQRHTEPPPPPPLTRGNRRRPAQESAT